MQQFSQLLHCLNLRQNLSNQLGHMQQNLTYTATTPALRTKQSHLTE